VKLQNVKFLKEGNQPVMQQIYSSPKGVVSLFQMRGDFDAKKFTDASQGKVNAYSWKADGSTYVIVAGQPRKNITALAAQVGGQ